jgi:hypothetical protein
MEGFKQYIKRSRTSQPKVCIRKNGQIAFNAGAIAKYDLDMYSHIKLFISDDKKFIAIEFTNPKNADKDGLISVQRRPGNFAVSCIPFLNIYDFAWNKTTNYDFNWIEKQRTAVFKPNKVGEEK